MPPAAVAMTPVTTGAMSQQPAWSTAQAVFSGPTTFEHFAVLQRIDPDNKPVPFVTRHWASQVLESVLDDLTADTVLVRRWETAESFGGQALPWDGVITVALPTVDSVPPGTRLQPVLEIATDRMPVPRTDASRLSAAAKASLTDMLLAAGFCSFSAGTLAARRVGSAGWRVASRNGERVPKSRK